MCKRIFNEVLEVKNDVVLRLEEILNYTDEEFQDAVSKGNLKEDTIYYSKIVKFSNGYFADVIVCTGQNNAYSDFILFNEKGVELTCTPGEELLGEVLFETEDYIFNLLIKSI